MRALLVCFFACLAGCQVLTSLSKFDVYVDADGAVPESGTCQVPEGKACNPVGQCGCPEDQHCQALGDDATPTCSAPGKNEAGSGCGSPSDCPKGQTCDRGSCRDYCRRDEDCDQGSCLPAAGPDGKPMTNLNVCWKSCEDDQVKCPGGTTCRSLKTPLASTGKYCVAPLDPCPSVEDGVCDDPRGTKACAKGTDDKDCECDPKLRGAQCDPVEQCGCKLDSSCEAMLDLASSDKVQQIGARCTPWGAGDLNQTCTNTSDCQRGLFCHPQLSVCTRYCSADVGCPGGACLPLPNQDNVSLGYCLTACNRDSGKPCSDKAVCATLDPAPSGKQSAPGDYCVAPRSTDCPHDGVCDEPKGTGRCAAGFDFEDCCKPPDPGSVCDPVDQCGCEQQPGTQCQHVTGSTKSMCQPEGKQEPGSKCTSDMGQCPAGYHCMFNVCRKYCDEPNDCGKAGSLCVPGVDAMGNRLPRVGACWMPCDYTVEGSCPSGTTCARTSAVLSFCIVPFSPCPADHVGNGQCDDTRPGGSRYCAMGTDPDCQ